MPVLCVLLTSHEVANLLGISTSELKKRAASSVGPCPFTRDGLLFDPQEVERHLSFELKGARTSPLPKVASESAYDGDRLLAPKEAATVLRSSVPTLARWRVLGTGPEYVKRGARVFYRTADLTAYVGDAKRRKTRPTP